MICAININVEHKISLEYQILVVKTLSIEINRGMQGILRLCISGGSRNSHGGHGPIGGVDPRRGCFLVKMFAKMKELGPIGGRANVYTSNRLFTHFTRLKQLKNY